MYDTVTFWLPIQQSGNDARELAGRLENAEVGLSLAGDFRVLKGSLGNLRVSVKAKGVRITGSLAKWHLGDNLKRLTRQETGRAVESLSDALHLPLAEAQVWRLDLGANLILQRPIESYLSSLGECRYHQRSTVTGLAGSSLYYQSKRKALALYDKAADCRRRKEPVPVVFRGRHMLRYECRFLRRLGTQFDGKVTASRLSEEGFYISALNRWKQGYFSIQKLQKLKMKDTLEVGTTRELVNQLALVGLQQLGGESGLLDLLRNEREAGRLGKMQHSRLRAKVRELAGTPEAIEPNECLAELDTKVRRAVACYR